MDEAEIVAYMKEKKKSEKNNENQNKINPLDRINTILMEQLERLSELDPTDTQNATTEIARNNAISTTSKTILQTVGIQVMIQKNHCTTPLIDKK